MNEQQNRGFVLPVDGFYNIAVYGDHPHKPTGFTQIIDEKCVDSIIARFERDSQQPNWPGVLIDFDHQSLDEDKPTVAAGWITALQKRDSGLWAFIRWSDLGLESIVGGRYRLISPVWRPKDCEKLGKDRIRPLRLMNAAVTNDPNMKGAFPLSNTDSPAGIRYPMPIPIANSRSPMTEEQRRAMFARINAGGGGSGSAPSPEPAAAEQPSQRSAAAEQPAASRPNPYRAQAEALAAERSALEASRPARPEPHHKFAKVDVRAAVAAEMRRPGSDSASVLAVKKAAEAQNASRQDEWKRKKSAYKKSTNGKPALERALARYIKSLDTHYEAEMKDWGEKITDWEGKRARLDEKLALANMKAEQFDFDEDKKGRTEAERAYERLIKIQMAENKAAAAKEVAEQRAAAARLKAAEQEQTRPEREMRQEYSKRSTFIDALISGDDAKAAQIYTGADIAKAKAELAKLRILPSDSKKDQAAKREALAAYRKLPPPMVS